MAIRTPNAIVGHAGGAVVGRAGGAMAALAGGVATAWLGMAAAHATTTAVQSLDFSLSNGGAVTMSQTLNFTGFNSSLGTLTEVDISVTGDSESGSITHSGSGSTYFRVSFDINAPDSTNLITATGSGNANAAQSPVALTVGALVPDPTTITTGLGAFTGSTALPFQAALDDPTVGNTGGEFFVSDSFTGTLNLDYVYTAADSAVPEPGSFWILSGGIVGLGAGGGWRTRRIAVRSALSTG